MPCIACPQQEHQQLSTAGEGAPELRPANKPATLGSIGAAAKSSDVGAEVRLRGRHRNELAAARDRWQPALLLLLGAGADQRANKDLGPRDQAPAGGKRGVRQLLGD